jgi:hypothetical protein
MYTTQTKVIPHSNPPREDIISKADFCLFRDYTPNYDGLHNRFTFLDTAEARKLFLTNQDIKIRTVPNPKKKQTKKIRVCFRWTWRVMSCNGKVSKGFKAFMERASFVILVLVGSLLLSLKDDFNKLMDNDPNTDVYLMEWVGNMFLIFMMSVFLNFVYFIEYIFMNPAPQRMNRLRFDQIEAQIQDLDPYAPSYSWEYDSDYDPDYEIENFRNPQNKDL